MQRAIKPFWGALVNVAGSAPAAGANFESVSIAGLHWRLRAVKFRFVTDANAANRHPQLVFLIDGGTNPFFVQTEQALTASVTTDVTFHCGGYGASKPAPNHLTIPMPYDLHFPPDWHFNIEILNIQVGDAISSISIFYDTWPEGAVAPTIP